jgi:hypothetical protein
MKELISFQQTSKQGDLARGLSSLPLLIHILFDWQRRLSDRRRYGMRLPTWADKKRVYAVVETPRGSRAKLEFAPKLNIRHLADIDPPNKDGCAWVPRVSAPKISKCPLVTLEGTLSWHLI